MRAMLKAALKNLPPIRGLVAERDAMVKAGGFVPPGHFYSPVVSIEEATRDQARIFREPTRSVPGIDFNESAQLELLACFEGFYASIPFHPRKTDGQRYYYENPAYSYSDAIFLHCMIRHLSPSRIVEVGSGFSSCAILDTNAAFFDNDISTLFVEPYPALLNSLIADEDRRRIEIVPQRLQDVDLEIFAELRPNDILFVDSTHVSKAGSDVNFLFFEILPVLKSGVFIHIHDVFHPFEYPKEWILGGRSWNEMYLLRAFLQYNAQFEIVFMNTFIECMHEDRIRQNMPLCLKNPGGSIWLRKR